MFRKYDPSGASTDWTPAATARYHSTYSPGSTGVNPLVGSYSRCVAYGGDVIATAARARASNFSTTARSRQSPHISRCFPICQTSPAVVTGVTGGSGISSATSWSCSPGSTGVNPLVGSYSRCVAYGGD